MAYAIKIEMVKKLIKATQDAMKHHYSKAVQISIKNALKSKPLLSHLI